MSPRTWLSPLLLATLVVMVGAGPAPEAAFPGANGKLAFISTRDGNAEVYAMNADGAGQTRLTANAASDFAPAWSPDGGKLAFASLRDGNWELYVMNADGTGQTRLTDNLAFDYEPAWSPDGSKLAFSSFRDGSWEVYVMNADGTGQVNLTENPAIDVAPAWSPDGGKIAFGSTRDGSYEVYVMNADGTGQANLTAHPGDDLEPAWSPDGGKIAYTSLRDGSYKVYAMNADGTGQTELSSTSADEFHPAWSPDGTKISFISVRNGDAEVYAMNADGSGQTNLSRSPADDYSQDWQPLPADTNRPPDCSALVADPQRIATAERHRFRTVTVSGARDPDGDELSVRLERVTQDEPVWGRAIGDPTSPDAKLAGGGHRSEVALRAERSPRGNGRVYRIGLVVLDAGGESCSGIVKVEVPRRRHQTAIDDGDVHSWDSVSGMQTAGAARLASGELGLQARSRWRPMWGLVNPG